MALKTTPQREPDQVLRYAHVARRLGALVAVILGLGMLFSLPTSMALHMGSGLLALLGIWLAAIRLAKQQRSSIVLWVAALLAVGGVVAALSGMGGMMHLVAMLLSLALAELGVFLSTARP